eukprot:67837_1
MAHKTKQIERKDGFNIKIISWNLWSIMMFSPRCLTNPNRCSDYVLSVANQQEWDKYDGLIVCGFQELWKWNTGIIPPFILSRFVYLFEYIPYCGHIISRLFQAVTFLCGTIPIFKLLNLFNYCPKKNVISKLNGVLEYNHYDNNIPLFPVFRLLDNGLLLLFNQKPDIHGSQSYDASKKDDWFASKGFIYCYFNEYNTLILNTHLQYRGDKEIKLKQLAQLRQFIDDFASKVEGAIKVMILGDFNCDMIIHEKIERIKTSDSASDLGLEGVIENETKNIKDRNNEYLDVPSVLGPQYHKVSSFSSTTRFSEKCIDHIFVNHDVTKYGEQIGGKNDKLSDHYCVINDFYSH